MLLIASLILLYNLVLKNEKTESEYTASANSLIFTGDYSGAVAECTKGLKEYPQNAELYLLKARAYLLSDNLEKAIGTLDQGYKQTQSEEILKQRNEITEKPIQDAKFDPLTEIGNTAVTTTEPSNVPDVSDASSAAITREPYVTEKPIEVEIPNVSPPPVTTVEITTTPPEITTALITSIVTSESETN